MRRIGLARRVAWNYAGYVYQVVLGVALIAYILRHVGMAEYGVFLLMSSVGGFFVLLDLGLPALLINAYPIERAARGNEGVSRLLSSAFFASLIIGALGLFVCVVMSFLLPWPFAFSEALTSKAGSVLIVTAFAVYIDFPARMLDATYASAYRFDTLNKIQIAIATLRAAAVVSFLHIGYGIVFLSFAQVGAVMLRLAILWYALRTNVEGARLALHYWDWKLLKSVWHPGKWVLLEYLGRDLAINSDAVILGLFGNIGAVGIYGVGAKLPFRLRQAVDRGVSVTLPEFSGHHAASQMAEARRVYLSTCRTAVTVLVPLCIVGLVFARPILEQWAGNQYAAGAAVMQLLLVATLCRALAGPSETLLYAFGRIQISATIIAVESVVNIGLSLALVGRFGGAGLAAATTITHLLGTVFGLVPVACQTIKLKMMELVVTLLKNALLPTMVLAAVLTLSCLLAPTLSTFWRFACGGIALLLYLIAYVAVKSAWMKPADQQT